MSKAPEATVKSKQQMKILDEMRRCAVIRAHPTSGEVINAITTGTNVVTNVSAWRARFSELRDRGLLVEIGERRCRISGRLSMTWGLTNRTVPLPVKRRRHDRPSVKIDELKSIAKRLANALDDALPHGAGDPPALVAYRKLEKRL